MRPGVELAQPGWPRRRNPYCVPVRCQILVYLSRDGTADQAGRLTVDRCFRINNIRQVGVSLSKSSEPPWPEMEAESRPGDSRPHLGNARPCSRLRRVDARRSRSAGSGSRAHIAARSDYTSSSAGAINSGSAKMRLRGCSSVG